MFKRFAGLDFVKIKRAFALAVMAAALPLCAQAANLKGTALVLRTLDKVTATTQDYTIKIGDVLQYGSLSIEAVHCEKRPPEEPPETYGFVKISSNRLDGTGETGEVEMLFSGWMFASRPAISALDHGVYDVWVIGCNTPARPPVFRQNLTPDDINRSDLRE